MVDHPSTVSKKECFCCTNKNVSDQHHIIPVQYGGPRSGQTVPVCPTCHRNIHREGEYYYKRKEWGKYVNSQNYPTKMYLDRAKTLASYIFQAKVAFESMEVKDKEQRNMIQISCTSEELKMIHVLKKDLGFTSLEKLIKYLIQDKVSELLKR